MEWIGKQDPYVKVELLEQKMKTKTHTDGGKNPKFNEGFIFTSAAGTDSLTISVFDEDTVSDDLIGTVTLTRYAPHPLPLPHPPGGLPAPHVRQRILYEKQIYYINIQLENSQNVITGWVIR